MTLQNELDSSFTRGSCSHCSLHPTLKPRLCMHSPDDSWYVSLQENVVLGRHTVAKLPKTSKLFAKMHGQISLRLASRVARVNVHSPMGRAGPHPTFEMRIATLSCWATWANNWIFEIGSVACGLLSHSLMAAATPKVLFSSISSMLFHFAMDSTSARASFSTARKFWRGLGPGFGAPGGFGWNWCFHSAGRINTTPRPKMSHYIG